MDAEQLQPDEAQELQEYLAVEHELAAARALEAAEFIRDEDESDAELEPTDDDGETQDAAPTLIADAGARRTYWQAHALVDLEQEEFAAAANDVARQRSAYYRLAVYHGRTISILRTALNAGREALAQAAMRNLAALHRAMMQMHRAAPHVAPVALMLDRRGRDDFARDLVVQALQESRAPLDLDGLLRRVNDLDVIGVARATVQRHLKDLVAAGHAALVEARPARYVRTARPYTGMDTDAPSLRAILGDDLYAHFAAAGVGGLRDVVARPHTSRAHFSQFTGMSDASAALFVDLVATLLEHRAPNAGAWSYTDLIGSPYPRPYQYEAYAVFRGYGYQGQLVEAPTGSGKTMIGMMCVQEWLQKLRPGQSILILAPTSNYLQQWTGELCYRQIGLRLAPEMVFTGTPNQLERFQKRTGSHPAVLVMTYTALSQAGSAIGKGGFDVDSIEMFLQNANVQHVILDEVHKVAENLQGIAADVIRLMVAWLSDGSLQGLIGFTGTAEAYRARFAKLGLQLVYSIPIDELIAAGFVAPFAELGAPFAYSARERRIRELLDSYKARTSAFMALLGGERLRGWFAELPMVDRVAIGHGLLGMYQGRKEWETALATRLASWERGATLSLTESKLVTIIQVARGWSDAELAAAAGVDAAAFQELVDDLLTLRTELALLIYLPATLKRLAAPDFARAFDVAALQAGYAAAPNQAARSEVVKDATAATIVGLYDGLSEWYRRVGEGRVETIKAVIEAERATRPVSGIIIFDTARRIQWKQGLAAPGYEGVGGLYAQLLGDERFTPYAVLSGEQYLPYSDDDPLPPRIAAFVAQELMAGEVAGAMFDLVVQGLDLSDAVRGDLHQRWRAAIAAYIAAIGDVHAPRPGDFSRRVLRALRRHIRDLQLDLTGERLLARLDLRNIHFADLVTTFFDYAIIARYFRHPQVAELEQVSGARQKFFVIPMSSGARKLLMYDLTARIVDADTLPINIVVVSTWARTGWNVIAPNVLIDATATRDVTAWQQLRGRAIRARRTWSNDCYRLVMALIGSQIQGMTDTDAMPADVEAVLAQVTQPQGETVQGETVLDARLWALLETVASGALQARIRAEGLRRLAPEERKALAVALMRRYNKVTHIFELVKAYGATTQVEYDRTARVWQRRASIAAKHEHEVSVNPFDGEKSSGASHAPLVYAEDPRADIPAALEEHLRQAIAGADDRIVGGWMQVS